MMPQNPNSSEAPHEDQAKAEDLAELLEYFLGYIGTVVDRGKLSINELWWRGVGWVCGVLVVSGAFLIALAFLFYGTSLGVAEFLGKDLWFGYFFSGLFFLMVTFLSLYLYRRSCKKMSLRKKVNAYEQRLHEQKARFGHTAEEQATMGHQN